MNFNAEQDNNSRLVGIGTVIALHALVIYGLVSGLARKAVEVLPVPIETKIIREARPPTPSIPPPTPDLVQPPPPPKLLYTPPPEIRVQTPPAPSRAVTQTTTAAVRVPAAPDIANSPRSCREPPYPAASERLGEEGTATVSLLIGIDGKVKESRIDESSGYTRLDEATIKAFSTCKFRVGTVNGRPEASWFSMRYRWVIPE